MDIKYNRANNGTVTIKTKSTAEEVFTAKTKAINQLSQFVTVPGFRTGKAPAAMSEGYIKEDKILEEVLNEIINSTYTQTVEKEGISPITQPTVNFQEFDEQHKINLTEILSKGVNYEIISYTIPDIKLNDWEQTVKKAQLHQKKKVKTDDKISPPDAPKTLQDEDTPEQKIEDIIFDALISEVKFELPEAIIQGEADQIIYRQIQTVQRLGVSYEDFLKIQKKTLEEIQKIALEEAEKTVRIRFIISEIAKNLDKKLGENPKVTDVIEYLVKLNNPKIAESTDIQK